MQTVSESWKNEHTKSILNESFVEISLDIADPIAIADARATSADNDDMDNGAIYISDSKSVTEGGEKSTVPYCTLEQNIWCLDGSRAVIPESNIKKNSFISDVLSDDSCVFSGKIPTITIDFNEIHSIPIPGITVTWSSAYDEFAESFDVIAYNGDTVVASKAVTGNKAVKSLIFVDIVNYNRVVILIRKWCLPHHRARVEDVLVGINKVYGKGELFNYSHKQSVDPVSTALPKFEINFSIDNIDGEYNPYNPYGLAKYLMERQEVKTRYGLKLDDGTIEWIPGGTFYLSEWYAKQNGITADFTARDVLEFMSEVYTENHDISKYRSLYELATMLLEKANLPKTSDGNNRWVLKWDTWAEIHTNAPLPEDTLANNLQLVANMGECVLYQDRDGILHIEPLKDIDSDYEINSFNSYSKSEITLSKPIKQVKVKVYTYTSATESTTTEVSYPQTVSEDVKGETIIIDNPLVINTPRAWSIGKWIYDYLGHRMTLDSSWRPDVSLDALDVVKNKNSYSTNQVRMTDVEFTYNGAFRGTGKGKVIGNG